MPDLLQAGSDWLADQLKQHASRSVVYRRGAAEVPVPAVIGRTLLKLDDGYGGVRMEWTDRDFLIHAADLVLGAAAVLPERGDTIRETVGPSTVVYEVKAKKGGISSLDEMLDLSKKLDVQGTFNALAVRGLGGETANARTAKAVDEINQNVRELVVEAKLGGPVFK